MKRIYFIITLLFAVFTTFAQDFNSKNVRIEDYNLTPIPGFNFARADTRIRKGVSNTDTLLFYQIEIINAVNSTAEPLIASLTKNEITEAREALTILLEQSKADANSKADHINNQYEFESGFSVGYYISYKKISWVLVQDNEIRREVFVAKDINAIVKSFSEAKIRIEQLEKE